MSRELLDDRIATALRELAEQGARISIAAVAALAGISRLCLYRKARARELNNRHIADTRLHAEANLASEVHRFQGPVGALAARVLHQGKLLRSLEGRPNTAAR